MSNDDRKPNILFRPDLEDDDDDEPVRRVGGATFASVNVAPPQFQRAAMSRSSASSVDPTMAAFQSKLYDPSPVTRPSTTTATSSATGWELQDVPTLPEFHPLERTAVFVPHTQASEVSTRVSNVLRDRSIEASYDHEKAKVKCVTPDGVDFRVRLYRGRGNFAHGIIVEVQRRFGASVNFHKDTQAILDAAEGKVPPPPPPSFGTSAIPLVSDSEDSDYEVDGTSSLNMVAMMLNHPGYDSQYLAYQTLIPLTSASKMGPATARAVSQELLRSGNNVGTKVLGLVLSTRRGDEDDMFKLRTMAMTVLANAIQATKASKIDLPLREQLRPMLIQELFQADKNPRDAQMAAICVEYLLQEDHDAAEFHDALEKAREVGTARHAGLCQQAQRCLDKIGSGRY